MTFAGPLIAWGPAFLACSTYQTNIILARHTSRLATLSAFSWMNARRGSTKSPISFEDVDDRAATAGAFLASGSWADCQPRWPQSTGLAGLSRSAQRLSQIAIIPVLMEA
jgi:hypothetical protein